MKVQCSCGAKCEFNVTPELAHSPVKFICPACGLDASEFVDGLVRQELGQTAVPTGVPVPLPVRMVAPPAAPVAVALAPPPAPAPRPAVAVRVHAQAPPQTEGAVSSPPRCPKHPSELALEKCYICSKPICPKCMELFGYVCSPLCKAKAESHGIAVPVYAPRSRVKMDWNVQKRPLT